MPGRLEERFDSVMPIELDRGRGETRNVSASGIYFITDVRIVKGMPVSFTLRFKQASGGRFLLRGEARVARVERLGTKFGVGAAISHYELERERAGAEPAAHAERQRKKTAPESGGPSGA